jgi:LysR family nitrogen assimilation transcriptional regulator
LETRRLHYFIQIAELGSLTRAAGMLRIAQPALSRQMRLLEEELGVTLFNRTPRGMQLTEDGEYLRGCVAAPLRELELGLQGMRSRPSAIEAHLVIGMPPGLAEALAERVATGMALRFPAIRFRLVEGPTGSLEDWLGRGLVDLAVLEEAARDDRLSQQRIAMLPMGLVGPANSDLSPDQPVKMLEVLRLPLVLPSHHMGIRGAIEDAAKRINSKPDVRFEADAARLIRDLVLRGIGYGILPEAYARPALGDAGLCFWPIVNPALTLNIVLASRRTSHAAGRQAREVEEAITDLIASGLERVALDHIATMG